MENVMGKVMEIGGAKMVPPNELILRSQNATSRLQPLVAEIMRSQIVTSS